MTGFLYARDLVKEETKLTEVKLMFDAENPTTAEEVLENEEIEKLYLRPSTMADYAALGKPPEESKEDQQAEGIQLYVNAKS